MSQHYPIYEVAAAYDQWSRTYETVENRTRDLSVIVLVQHIKNLHEWNILELGCGTGLCTSYLAQQSRSVLAVDFSPGMLTQARANISATNVRFEQWDIRQQWNLGDAAVDLIVCQLVLEHIQELSPIFREASRVLRPGGEFFLCELHPYRQLQGSQAQFTNTLSGNTVLVPAYLHDVSDYVNTSQKFGFELLHLGEWRDEKASKATPPRLLSLHMRLP